MIISISCGSRNPMNNQNQTSPKAKQFAEELDELMKKYQYTLVAELDVKKTGLVPYIAIHEIVPPKGNPVVTAPVVEETPGGASGAVVIKKDKKKK